MKQALCVTNLNDFNRLSEGEIETIEFQFVDRAICELPENGFFQLIPYISFSQLDVPGGKLNCVVYRRPSKQEGDVRLEGKSSVGLGGHIDNVADLTFTSSVTTESGVTLYHMSLNDIKQTCMTCARRELVEEIGFDALEELQVPNEHINIGLEREQNPDEVGTVHLCASIKVNLDEARMQSFFEKAKMQETEIQDLRSLSINVEAFMGSFNVAEAMTQMNSQLEKELQMEVWSVMVINTLLTQLVTFFQTNWNFKQVMDGMLTNIQDKITAEQSPTVVTDVEPKPVSDDSSDAMHAPV